MIRIGSRGSRLALWQANFLQAQLKETGEESQIEVISTKGDQIQHLGFDKIEGKGFFTKEIEDALLNKSIDLAVHSMKDLPTTSPPGLVTTAVSYRDNPADWMLIRKECVDPSALLKLPPNPIVGTSSARRKATILDFRPDAQLKDIRGNVPTRVEKLRAGDFDAIILAGAGLSRLALDLSDLEVVKFSPKEFVPAPAQGVLAFQVREDDKPLRRILKQIHHKQVADCTNVERRVLQLMDGGCHLPLGVYCEKDERNNYHVWAAFSTGISAPLKKVQLSSGTHFELAQRTYDALMNDF